MTLQATVLLHKHKDLSSNPQVPREKLGMFLQVFVLLILRG